MPKDLFSRQSQAYARFRPTYPAALYDFVYAQCRSFQKAWDCATGNGQAASVLARKFGEVLATDISNRQLSHASVHPNIRYENSPAEHTSFPSRSFDLVTVGQAIHWFDLPAFFKEAQRVLKPDGVLAFWGYGLFRIAPEPDSIIDHFYKHIVGPYWDAERKMIDDKYTSIKTPFREIACPSFSITKTMDLETLCHYIGTWSGVQKYIAANEADPVDRLKNELAKVWQPHEVKTVSHPVFLRVCLMQTTSIH